MYDLRILKQNKTEVQERKVIPKRMSVFYPPSSYITRIKELRC
jgi:hypothetical protein